MALDIRQMRGVVPVMVMVWKSLQMTLWNSGGMCFSRNPGMLSGPGLFDLAVYVGLLERLPSLGYL